VKDLDGKVAFITGGASGIGFGMARVFLRHGIKVVIADLNEANIADARQQLEGTNLPVHFLKVDVSDRAAMAKAADETERVFGKVHIVCNNAGVGGGGPIDEAGYDDWDWLFGVNVHGVINGIVSFLPRIKAHGEGGHIVNTASMAGLIPLTAAGGIYSASKFAVRGITDSLRLALAPTNIGVSVLCPGLTRSRIMQSEENRPDRSPTRPPRPTMDPLLPSSTGAGMDPLELGQRVLLGIQRNDAYILPHGEFKDEVAGLFDEILAAFPVGQEIDPGRLEFERIRREETERMKALLREGQRRAANETP
jgi:NAD(P)-dependent dehydrogenase (short-subunit alcohol dehydrogenase family)